MKKSTRCMYNNSFEEFLVESEDSIFGKLCENYHGDMLTTTRDAWKDEIITMKETLSQCENKEGNIVFEYDIPRLGKRIDVVLLYRGIIFCIEFKGRKFNKTELQGALDQVLDYALDLNSFHKFSQGRVIIPILVPIKYKESSLNVIRSGYDDHVMNPIITEGKGLHEAIRRVLIEFPNEDTIDDRWIISPYAPTPTIIEAARSLYVNHTVENITRHEADEVSTDRTIAYVLKVIRDSEENKKKSICFVTGVPGAGKTLVGLEVAIKQTYQGGDSPVEDEGAVYLSGNGPLVAVLVEALARDDCARCKKKKRITDSRREVGKSIQMIHRYRDNMLQKIKNPVENGILEIDPEKAVKVSGAGFGEVEHVAIFDEAQRSWTHKRLADYLKRGVL